MAIELYEHQKEAVEKLRSGSILVGGVGSGKSRTGLAYYFIKECGGKIKTNGVGGYSPMKNPKDLFVITTARKRDTLEWEQECCPFLLSTNRESSVCGVKVTVDSWNNIGKYIDIKDAFFIFDEQKVIGSGAWVKAFYKICVKNNWILMSATPGDTWMDYIPVFVANGFYKNRTEFIRNHVIYSRYSKWPKVDRYIEVSKLVKFRDQIIVNMKYNKKTIAHDKTIITDFNRDQLNTLMIRRWNFYEDKPVKDVSQLCFLMRKVINSDPSKAEAIRTLAKIHPRLIIFYNFDYELDILIKLGKEINIPFAQWNGHKHESIPETESWLYLNQYSAGAEAWNCIITNAMVFYSPTYSYKTMIQSAGRIDRSNTPYMDLYYYHLWSMAPIDLAIQKSLKNKQNFNEHRFLNV